MPPFRILNLSGTHFEMGYTHGEAYADEIHAITQERIDLSTESEWLGHSVSRKRVLELAEASIPQHEAYSPRLMQQLEGMSQATGLSIAELIIANGFTDFIDFVYAETRDETQPATRGNECTSWLIGNEIAENRQGMFAQTWDMHDTATPHVIMIHGKPQYELEFMALSLTGCIAMIGMNSAGITVGINNLVGNDGRNGVTWPFVCRKILMQDNIDAALACITQAQLMGGHNYMLMDAEGNGYNVEAMASRNVITPLNESVLAHANMCLHPETIAVQRPLSDDLKTDSDLRARRVQTELKHKSNIGVNDMITLQRNSDDGDYSICSVSTAPYFSETCAAIVMKPATREIWATWGMPNQNEYEYFQLPVQ